MVGAMVVLLALIGVYVLFQSLTREDPPNPVQAVGYLQPAQYARKTASIDVLAPMRLPAGWRATTVGFTPAPDQHWHLGVLTDQNRYVGLEQGDVSVHAIVTTYVDKHPSKGDPVQVAGGTWATYTDSGGDLALVNREGNTTTLVVGHDVAEAQLAHYVTTLR
jgi:Protein of unknown function (DUF4245)